MPNFISLKKKKKKSSERATGVWNSVYDFNGMWGEIRSSQILILWNQMTIIKLLIKFIRFFEVWCTVKKTCNFTDPVMGNCDKKSTGNRKFTGKCPYILYINGQFTVLLQIFCKFTGNWPYFTGFTVYSPENLLPGNAPFFQITGHFPAANFPGNMP